MNDPWAVDPPKISDHHVRRILELIADYTAAEAVDLIDALARRRAPGPCSACGRTPHSSTCPTQGDRS